MLNSPPYRDGNFEWKIMYIFSSIKWDAQKTHTDYLILASPRAFFKNLSVGGRGASTKKDHTILSVEGWQMVLYGVVCNSRGSGGILPQKIFELFHP
jgi:hypothetical protein